MKKIQKAREEKGVEIEEWEAQEHERDRERERERETETERDWLCKEELLIPNRYDSNNNVNEKKADNKGDGERRQECVNKHMKLCMRIKRKWNLLFKENSDIDL